MVMYKRLPYCLVLAFHGLFLVLSIFSIQTKPIKKNKIHISLQESAPKQAITPIKSAATKVIPQKPVAKSNIPRKKSVAQKKEIPTKAKPLPKQKKKPEFTAKQENLLKELDQSIAKIEQNADKVYSGKEQTAPLASVLHIEETNESIDPSWSEKVAFFLEEELKLVEYGNVKMKLSIDAYGKVVKIETLDSESPINETYLQNTLSKLTFPFYGGAKPPKTQTITITFCHEI